MADDKSDLKKIENKLLKGEFDRVIVEGDGVRVEKDYHTIKVYATVNKDGNVSEVKNDIKLLTWILTILLFPIGLLALGYAVAQAGSRKDRMRTQIRKCVAE